MKTNNNNLYALAIDVGTTSLKTAIISQDGTCAATHIREYELIKPKPDIVELNPEVYWNAAVEAIRSVLIKAQVPHMAITTIGVTSHGESLILLDSNGGPLRNTIVWLDNRATAEAEEIAANFDLETVYRITGQQEIAPAWPAAKILWLKNNEPEIFNKTAKFLMVEDFIIYKLTGNFATDCALNPSSLYFDIIKYDWWQEMLDFLNIPKHKLPKLQFSGECAGTVTGEAASITGVLPGTPVTTAPIDQVAAAVGAGNIEPGIVSENTGAALAICATVDKPIYDPKKRLGLYCHAEKGKYVFLPWVPTAGMVLRWFRDEFGEGNNYDAICKEAAKIPPGSDGLIMLPFLAGAVSPDFLPMARGVFWGITLSHKKAHFTRAVMESIAFLLKSNIDMLEDIGCTAQNILSLGGAARNKAWVQIKSDVCRKQFTIMESQEVTCSGTAMLALTGIGVFNNLQEASKAMVRTGQSFAPNPSLKTDYEDAYKRYLTAYEANVRLFN
ncbi:MAG: hypothetical protein GX811_09910 [Lentisphaerae bacterium]|nr:hypothetical protein [Lentisphaerota bacterium]